MGRKKKPFRVYLFTRPPKTTEDNGEVLSKTLSLRVQAIVDGKNHFAVLPIKVKNFPEYYNSDGTLKDGYVAKSLKGKWERDCISAAYKAACRVVESMLSNGDEIWRLAPHSCFSEFVNKEYDSLIGGGSALYQYKKTRIMAKINYIDNHGKSEYI